MDASVKMPLVVLPVRTVIATVPEGRVMISPASTLTPQQLTSAGPLTDLVAPSLFHLGGMKAAAAAHPGAKLWGPQGCREKAPGLHWHGVFGVDGWPHNDVLHAEVIQGMPKVNEVVFLHRPSRSLIVADLVFNITDAEGFGPWLIFSLFGTYQRFGVSRLFLKAATDRAAMTASMSRIVALDFDHLVPSHGAVARDTGRTQLVEALRTRGVSV